MEGRTFPQADWLRKTPSRGADDSCSLRAPTSRVRAPGRWSQMSWPQHRSRRGHWRQRRRRRAVLTLTPRGGIVGSGGSGCPARPRARCPSQVATRPPPPPIDLSLLFRRTERRSCTDPRSRRGRIGSWLGWRTPGPRLFLTPGTFIAAGLLPGNAPVTGEAPPPSSPPPPSPFTLRPPPSPPSPPPPSVSVLGKRRRGVPPFSPHLESFVPVIAVAVRWDRRFQ